MPSEGAYQLVVFSRDEARAFPLPCAGEVLIIIEALESCRGNQSEAARLLGIPRRTLVSRLSEMGLTRRQTSDAED